MIRIIQNLIMIMLFGKQSLDGYYTIPRKRSISKDYIYSSVFPSREIMEMAIGQEQLIDNNS